MTASIAKAKVDQYMKTKEAERVAEQEKIRVSISGYLANVYDAIDKAATEGKMACMYWFPITSEETRRISDQMQFFLKLDGYRVFSDLNPNGISISWM